MSYIIAILVTFVLLAGFLALTAVEASRSVRVMGGARKRLDRKVGQVGFILEHVDLGSFVRDTVRDGLERVVHDIAHASLLVVRFIERLLTRFVRNLRGRSEDQVVRSRRSFREAVEHVKRTVRLRRISIQERKEGE